MNWHICLCWCDLSVLRLSTEIIDNVDGACGELQVAASHPDQDFKKFCIFNISTSKFYDLQNDWNVSVS